MKPATTKPAPVGRGEVSLATVAHELERLLAEEPPAWLSPEALDAARVLAPLLTRDAARVLASVRPDAAAADALGVGLRTLRRWLADGWPVSRDDTAEPRR